MGFTQKSAEEFFELIKKHGIEILIDIRLNNQSQLAGFSKGRDLSYFLKEICGCDYQHVVDFAPTKEILDAYKKGEISWDEYEVAYNDLIKRRRVQAKFSDLFSSYEKVLLLCSEPTPECCHRRLLSEYLADEIPQTKIYHIIDINGGTISVSE